eukprot:XP_001709638.1 Hypothetical protein GL50803_20908 [Giardia lamblia ATCC 50803]
MQYNIELLFRASQNILDCPLQCLLSASTLMGSMLRQGPATQHIIRRPPLFHDERALHVSPQRMNRSSSKQISCLSVSELCLSGSAVATGPPLWPGWLPTSTNLHGVKRQA